MSFPLFCFLRSYLNSNYWMFMNKALFHQYADGGKRLEFRTPLTIILGNFYEILKLRSYRFRKYDTYKNTSL